MKTSFLTVVSVLSAIVASTSAFATNENTVTSKSYVDAMDATKQDIIDTDMVSIGDGKDLNWTMPALVSYDTTNGLTGDTTGLLKSDTYNGDWWENGYLSASDSIVPSAGAVANAVNSKQNTIQATGTNASTPGSTVVTYTGTAGTIGERGIYDDSTTYSAQNDSDSLVTAGAMMSAISSGVSALPTTTTSKLTCSNPPTCTLWRMDDHLVYGEAPLPVASGFEVSCKNEGSSCSGNNSCCSGLECVNGTCRTPQQQ